MGARVVVGISQHRESGIAAREATRSAAEQLGRSETDLAVVFFSAEHAPEAERISATVRDLLGPRVLVGASTEAAIGQGRELEDLPGVSVLAASLPGATLNGYPIDVVAGPDGAMLELPADFDAPEPAEGSLVLLADPYSFPVDAFLAVLGERWSGAVAVGGLASGGSRAGEHALLCDGRVLHRGAVALSVGGGVAVRSVVSQGCAPIGGDMVVTAADGHVVSELAGRPAYERLVEVVDGLDDDTRDKARTGVVVGLVIDENRAEYRRGDYLIRGVMGGDPESGSLVVADEPRVGQTMRFHVRDADTADRDLRDALRSEAAIAPGRVLGALLFACNGRGTGMFAMPDHDAGALDDELSVPAAGMFCAGEIGPVGGISFVHGFTATMGLLVETG
jgi:small ligand-binding sensory domain FIST